MGVFTVSVTFTVCERFPLTPVTGIVYVPGELKLESVLIVSVEEPELAIEVGERVAVAPPGKNDEFKLRATVPVKPFSGEAVIVYEAIPPALTARLGVGAVRVKSPGCGGGGGAFTVRETLVVCTSMPLVALIVRLRVPTGVEAAVHTLRVEEPAPVTEAGLKLAVALTGSVLPRLNFTVLLKPLTRAATEAV